MGRLDVGELQLALRVQGRSLRRGGGDTRLRLGDRGAIVVIDDLRQQLAALHALEILDRQIAHIAADLGGDRREVGLQIGVIGSLPARPALPAGPVGRDDDDDPDGDHEYQDAPGELEDPVPVDLRNVGISPWFSFVEIIRQGRASFCTTVCDRLQPPERPCDGSKAAATARRPPSVQHLPDALESDKPFRPSQTVGHGARLRRRSHRSPAAW